MLAFFAAVLESHDASMKKPTNRWKIALGQIAVTMGDKRANTAAVLEMLDEAARKRCDVVVFPECCLAGWLSPAARDCAENIPGPFTRRLAAAARRHRLTIVIGMEERCRDGQLFNAAVLIDPTGTIRLHHRKINELEMALSLYATGTSLNVATVEGRKVALSICADSWRPEVTDALWLMEARVIFSPSAWAVDPGGEATNLNWIKETYRHRIGVRDLWIVAPNGAAAVSQGPWRGRVLQGNSLVIGPGGYPLLVGPTGQAALLCCELPV